MNIWNVASVTEELNFKKLFIFSELTCKLPYGANSILDSVGLEFKTSIISISLQQSNDLVLCLNSKALVLKKYQ